MGSEMCIRDRLYTLDGAGTLIAKVKSILRWNPSSWNGEGHSSHHHRRSRACVQLPPYYSLDQSSAPLQDVYDGIRVATAADVAGIVELIGPLEAKGILVPRPIHELTRDVHQVSLRHRPCAFAPDFPMDYWPHTSPPSPTSFLGALLVIVHLALLAGILLRIDPR